MSHRQLNERDRFYIEQRLAEGDSHGKIGRSLGVHRTTILREIKSHTPINFNNLYCYRLASRMARDKRSQAKKGVAFRDIKEQTKEFIHTRLSTHTSPDVISGELSLKREVRAPFIVISKRIDSMVETCINYYLIGGRPIN